jgi:hypothetical protein
VRLADVLPAVRLMKHRGFVTERAVHGGETRHAPIGLTCRGRPPPKSLLSSMMYV